VVVEKVAGSDWEPLKDVKVVAKALLKFTGNLEK
jgi:hypothetical protein